MTWKIEEIGIYSKVTGELHTVRFPNAGLNVISGESSRGKSALLDIVDYGLLSRTCPIAKGVIRDKCSYVGILLKKGDERFVVVRPLPKGTKQTTTEVFLDRGPGISLPTEAPNCRWNLDGAKSQLGEFTGIELLPVLTNYTSSDPEKKLAASIRHCVPYLLQPQDVIASRSVAFPGIEDSWYRKAVADAALYFLGLFRPEDLENKRRLRALILERNRIRRKVDEERRLKILGLERGRTLWNEAVALGLMGGGRQPMTEQDLLRTLSKAPKAAFDGILGLGATPDFEAAQREEASLRTEVRRGREELAEIVRFIEGSQSNEKLTQHQIGRLRFHEMLPSSSATSSRTCPLCQKETMEIKDVENELNRSVEILQHATTSPKRLVSQLEKKRFQLGEKLNGLGAQLDDVRSRIRKMGEQLDEDRKLLARAQARERLVGQIEEYVRSMTATKGPEQDDPGELEKEIRRLEDMVGDSSIDEKLAAVQDDISNRMTRLTRELEVEFPGRPVRLNFDSLRIEVAMDPGAPEHWTPLDEVGSGANWLGYHIVTVLALQDYFIEQKAPVPAFVMLDQPSQVWFPAKLAEVTRSVRPEKDSDYEAARKVYALLHRVASQDGGPKIIVVDHAKFVDEWFKDSLVDEWRDGRALVPEHWPRPPSGS